MKSIEIAQIVLFFGLGIALTPVLGRFMAWILIFTGEKNFPCPLSLPIEKLSSGRAGIDPASAKSDLIVRPTFPSSFRRRLPAHQTGRQPMHRVIPRRSFSSPAT